MWAMFSCSFVLILFMLQSKFILSQTNSFGSISCAACFMCACVWVAIQNALAAVLCVYGSDGVFMPRTYDIDKFLFISTPKVSALPQLHLCNLHPLPFLFLCDIIFNSINRWIRWSDSFRCEFGSWGLQFKSDVNHIDCYAISLRFELLINRK